MKLHLPSVLVSMAVVGAVALLTSQSQPATLNPAVLRVEYVPHPRDYVQIRGVDPYVVPVGRVLVLTAVGSESGNGITSVKIDNQLEVLVRDDGGLQRSSLVPLPDGFTVQAGSSVQLLNSVNAPAADRRAWGYLASQ